jgi:ribosome-binding factor A
MPTPRRVAKIESQLRQEVATMILTELRDPRLGFITITRVKVTPDLTLATIYYTTLGGSSEASKTRAAFDDARGLVQGHIGKVIRSRVVPKIRFRYDDELQEQMRLDNVIDEIRTEIAVAEGHPPCDASDDEEDEDSDEEEEDDSDESASDEDEPEASST